MNTKTTITFKTDKKLRDQAKKMAAKLGIPLTTIINARLAEFVRDGSFEVSLTPRPEKLAEWAAERIELQRNPREVITLRNTEEVRAHFKKLLRSSRKK
jgi:antitoxin component of RelBE/YafQ-DinJ toxin-antitoxin module